MNTSSVIYGICLLLLLWHFINGWRKGPARMLIKLFALAAGYVAALLLGEPVAGLLQPLGYPHVVLLALARAGVALVAYAIAIVCGAILFKRTGQQEVGLVRLFYGLTGAAIGLVFGLAMVWLFIVSVRVGGAMALAILPSRDTANPGYTERALALLRDWKLELEGGPIAPLVKVSDPFRESDYENAERAGVVLSQPERMRRFVEAPALREWAGDQRFRALANDAQLVELARARDFHALLRHPKVVALLDDPELKARALRTDFAAALREAVPEPPRAK